MKITTQRTLVWVINFALVLTLLLLAVVMARNDSRTRGKRVQADTMDLERLLRDTKVSNSGGTSEAPNPGQLSSVLSGNFVGPVEPPQKPKTVEVDPNQKVPAPDINTLIALRSIWASSTPTGTESGPSLAIRSSVTLIHKSKPVNENSYIYFLGDVIGNGTAFDPKEVETTMQKFGGATVTKIEDTQITLRWGDADVVVTLEVDPEPTGGTFTTQDGKTYGSDKSSGNRSSATPIEEEFKLLPPTQENRDVVEVTAAGMKTLDERGDLIIQSIAFEEVSGEGNQKNLKVTSLPSELAERGFREGDVIVRIDAEPVTTRESIISYVKRTYKGKTSYLVTLMRDGNIRTVEVKVPSQAELFRQQQRNRINTPRPR